MIYQFCGSGPLKVNVVAVLICKSKLCNVSPPNNEKTQWSMSPNVIMSSVRTSEVLLDVSLSPAESTVA